ncbi:MAG TPA: MSMEG_6728 family protein, partial [Ktedonobacteraceae bacterium]|nr:MSMEG_6728 family protein [Ktedonobacteraceae bacterium]
MQTFLPYPSFEEVAGILDYRRLGKQRVEGLQIINIITTPDYVGGWMNHPAVKMWRGYENALKLYVNTMIVEWKRRNYQNTMQIYDLSNVEIVYPWWLGDPRLHDSHKSNLLRKEPAYYRQFGWDVPDDLPYFWPVP